MYFELRPCDPKFFGITTPKQLLSAMQGLPNLPGVQDLAEGGERKPLLPSAPSPETRGFEDPFHDLAPQGHHPAAGSHRVRGQCSNCHEPKLLGVGSKAAEPSGRCSAFAAQPQHNTPKGQRLGWGPPPVLFAADWCAEPAGLPGLEGVGIHRSGHCRLYSFHQAAEPQGGLSL